VNITSLMQLPRIVSQWNDSTLKEAIGVASTHEGDLFFVCITTDSYGVKRLSLHESVSECASSGVVTVNTPSNTQPVPPLRVDWNIEAAALLPQQMHTHVPDGDGWKSIDTPLTPVQAMAREALKGVPDGPEPMPDHEQAKAVARSPHTEYLAAKPKAAEPAAHTGQASIFDEEPEPIPFERPFDIAPESPNAYTDPVAANADIAESQPAATGGLPTANQYKAYTARCTKLVRDVLPKAGKGASDLLMPWLKRKMGISNMADATIQNWDLYLPMVESAPTAAIAVKLLKES
jgi:hypothetical protein